MPNKPGEQALRVLSVIHSSTFSGPHNQAIAMVSTIPDIQLTVVLPDEPGDAASRLMDGGVEVLRLDLRRPRASLRNQGLVDLVVRYPSQIGALVNLIRQRATDVVEAHGLMNLDAPLAAKISGCALVWQLIDSRPPRALRWALMPALLSFADVIMTTGTTLSRVYPGARLRPSRLRTFAPPVVAAREPSSPRSYVRARLDVEPDDVLVVSIGNLNPQKGFDALLDALGWPEHSPGLPRRPALRIRGALQLGHEAYAARLSDLAATGGFGANSVGQLEPGLTVTDVLHAADIFALTSLPRSEGIPTVVLEAMSAGLPVVATNVGALGEIIEDGVTGYLVEPGDTRLMRRRLAELAEDAHHRSSLGAAARVYASSLSSPEKFGQLMLEAFRAAIEYKHRARLHRGELGPK